MGRLIDVEWLKESIDKCDICDICPDKAIGCSYDCGFPDALDKWEKLIDAQPTVELPTWITCSERLPEEETECLVTDSHGRIRHCVKDKCGNYEFATYEEYMHIDAIAWMPLPKAYEETDHE